MSIIIDHHVGRVSLVFRGRKWRGSWVKGVTHLPITDTICHCWHWFTTYWHLELVQSLCCPLVKFWIIRLDGTARFQGWTLRQNDTRMAPIFVSKAGTWIRVVAVMIEKIIYYRGLPHSSVKIHVATIRIVNENKEGSGTFQLIVGSQNPCQGKGTNLTSHQNLTSRF